MSVLDVQSRLELTFKKLSDKRKKASKSARVFALEHGLDSGEREHIFKIVKDVLQHNKDKDELWLLFVIASTEIGYQFAGTEYWQTFEEHFPGGGNSSNRQWLRTAFEKFQKNFHGPTPSGTWASHFQIIAHPVTNAILPLDLQWQFLSILYKLRPILQERHFLDPEFLAKTIEARYPPYGSARFKNFLQNRNMVWQFTSILLNEDFGENKEFLSTSTLERIVNDLEKEKSLKEYLKDTRRQVQKLIFKGAKSDIKAKKSGQQKLTKATSRINLNPVLHLKANEHDQYDLIMDLPDLELIYSNEPDLKSELLSLRCNVNFSSFRGPVPLARFFSTRRPVPMKEWPQNGVPILSAVNSSNHEVLKILKSICLENSGIGWLFKERSNGLATHVKSGTIRPSSTYIIIVEQIEETNLNLPQLNISCEGVCVYRFDSDESGNIPLKDEELLDIGLSKVGQLSLRPVGVAPANWDSEGQVEWLSTDPCILEMSVGEQVDSVLLSLKGIKQRVKTVQMDKEVQLIQLPKLHPGSYSLNLITQSSIDEIDGMSANIDIIIREPKLWAKGESPCNPILITTFPIRPTFESLLENELELEITGPVGGQIEIDTCFKRWRNNILHEIPKFKAVLPINPLQWRELFKKNVTDKLRKFILDEATLCEIHFTGKELGDAKYYFHRQDSALRWSIIRNRNSAQIKLYDDTDEIETPTVLFYHSENPDKSFEISYDDALMGIEIKQSGLFYVESKQSKSSIVVSDSMEVSSLADLQKKYQLKPVVSPDVWSSISLLDALCLIEKWSYAKSFSDDLFSTQIQKEALLALGRGLFGYLGGKQWLSYEEDIYNNLDPPRTLLSMFKKIVKSWHFTLNFANAIRNSLDEIPHKTTDLRVLWFAYRLESLKFFGQSKSFDFLVWYSEFILRLATEPGRIRDWAQNKFDTGITILSEEPFVTLLARYFVLCVEHKMHDKKISDTGYLYANWRWHNG